MADESIHFARCWGAARPATNERLFSLPRLVMSLPARASNLHQDACGSGDWTIPQRTHSTIIDWQLCEKRDFISIDVLCI